MAPFISAQSSFGIAAVLPRRRVSPSPAPSRCASASPAPAPHRAAVPWRAQPLPPASAGGSRCLARVVRAVRRPRDAPAVRARPADPGAAPCLTGAVKECEENQFQCRNERCIPAIWKCDEDDDCSDNSDEADCREYPCPARRGGGREGRASQLRCASVL